MSHASEQNTRRELANELQRRGASPSGVLHASEFQDALDQLGLRFGSPVVDRIMLACSIDGDGHVNVTNFLTEVEAESRAGEEGAHGEIDSAYGYTNAAYSPPGGAENQADHVRRVTRPLHALYQAFDAGEIELSNLRAGLSELGLVETPDTVKLLRERDFSFRQLVTALSREDTTELLNRAAGEVPERRRDKEGDIVTHRRGRAPTSERAHGSDVISWHYDPGDDGPPTRGGAHADVVESRRAAFQSGTGVARSIEGNVPAAAAPPATEIGLIREQVFSSVRLLDQGAISSAAFRRRLEDLGVRPTHEIERLIQLQDKNGTARFRDFVRAFDAYFRDYMPEETTKASPSRVPAPYYTEDPDGDHPKKRIFTEEGLAGRREGQRPPTAVMTHGDIIAWSHGETELEQAEHQPHGKHHSLQKKVEVTQQSGDILAWDEGANHEPDDFRSRPAPMRRVAGPSQGAGDIIAWSNVRADHIDPDEAATLRQTSRSGRGKDHRVPFGTDHDLGPGQAREGFHPKVPAKTRAHYPQPRTGEWFRTPAAERPSNVHVSAPFGTDTDVPFPQRR